ncbi:hypothetical protein FB45DRAFT_1043194 [Roridomyces roridus]|uniref:Uncharacterized protein n=1 Tax=Roridomyces roridus TaxID=1738132 RepID=A0AAD7AYT5_9AGAR|nr:hypothetical protein FB45DRAFT_1043194 [Roridomyces roridus]
MSSPSPRPNLPPTNSATGERYTTYVPFLLSLSMADEYGLTSFDAHFAADAHLALHAHAHTEPCKSTFAALSAFGTLDGEGIERPWDLASKNKKAKL